MATSVYDCSEGDPISTVSDSGTLGRAGSATDVSAAAAIAPSGTGAFSFNGTSSIITIAAGFDDLIDDLDVTFWLQCSDNVSYQPLVEAGGCGGWALYLSGGVVRFGNRCADETAAATDVCDGNTHKVRVTCVAGAVTIYVDDVSDGTGTTNDAWASGSGYNIGGNGFAFFAGTLDNITISGTQAAPPASGPVVSLTASPSSIAENGGTATIIATMDATASATVTVAVGFAGSASTGSDYTLSTTSIAIASGQTSGSLTATAINDSVYEGNEAFTASITSVTGGGASASSTASNAIVTIVDDESAPTVNLSVSATSIAENLATAYVVASLANASYQNVTVNFGFSGSATLNTDYSASSNSLIVTAGNTSGSISITAIQDTLDEDNESILVGITSVTNGSAGATSSLSVTVTDDDAVPSVSVSASQASIAENGGSAFFLGTLSAASGRTASATVNFAFGSATLNTDFTASTTAFFWPAGTTTASIGVTSLADVAFESNETIVCVLGSFTNCAVGLPFSASMTIVNEYLAPFVSLSASVSSLAESGSTATIVASLDHTHSANVTVVLGFGGTATDSSDYTKTTDTIVILSGASTGTISITSIQDTVSESQETIVVSLSSVTNGSKASAASTTTVIIIDDDTRGSGATGLSGLSGLSGVH